MFNNSKYGNVLTVVLIISVIAIIGIIGIIIYRVYNANEVNNGATYAATEFEQITQQNSVENSITNQINSEINIDGLNTLDNENQTESTKKKYKGYDVVGTIHIPSINIKYPILEQLTKKSLETSVVLLYTAQGLNNQGNTVIIGHNYRNGTMFSNVKNLSNGDYIYITDQSGNKVKYTVYNIYRAPGSESDYITRNTNGKREISLSTCTDDSKARTIVWARED